MKIKCEKANFLKGLQTVAKAVSAKNTIYALSGILITAKNGELIFSATDIEIAIEYRDNDITIEEEGSLIIPGRYILEIAKKLPEGELELASEGYTFYIRYGSSEITVNGLDKEEFPEFPGVEGDVSGIFSMARFENDIKEVAVAASPDESRPLFTGVLFEIDGNQVNFVATDTHRLAMKKSTWNATGTDNSVSVVVPNKILQEMIRTDIEEDSKLEVVIGAKQISFRYENTLYVSRLIEGKFPNYHQVIPDENRVKAVAEVDAFFLLSTLERAFILSKELVREHVGRVNIALANDILTVDSRSPEMGHIHEEIPVQQQGEDMALIFNARYLLDILRVIDSETILMKFTGPNTPLLLGRKDDEGYVYLALPLKA
jgi:DNA polymerase-3 subunit beta